MKTRSIIIALCIISFVISSCAPTAPQATVTPSPTPTSTPMPTYTPTVTPHPTATTDPFAGLNQCHEWRDAKENCIVSLEDLMSGKLVDFARAVTKPFPADAYYLVPYIESFLTSETVVFSAWSDNPDDKALLKGDLHKKPFTSPKSPVGESLIFWVKGDGTSNLNFDVLAVVTKIKNKDGTDGYYTVIKYPLIDQDGSVLTNEVDTYKYFDDAFENQIYQPPFRSSESVNSDYWKSIFEKYGKYILEINNDETTKILLDKWMKDWIIPTDLEKRPLVANSFSVIGSGVQWVK